MTIVLIMILSTVVFVGTVLIAYLTTINKSMRDKIHTLEMDAVECLDRSNKANIEVYVLKNLLRDEREMVKSLEAELEPYRKTNGMCRELGV